MRSSNKLILLILSAITLILVTESERAIPSEEERKDLEELLNHINKPAIKTFHSKHGYILDCIDIHKQLAFDHPLLKNHTIQLKPTTIPKWTRDNNTTSQKTSSLPFPQDDDITCPLGTVIIKRTTVEDLIQFQRLKSLGFKPTSNDSNNDDPPGHHSAIAQYYDDIYGAMAKINVWDPHVKPDQYSLASIHLEGGFRNELQTISAGWIVNPKLNQNHSGIFISWSANGKGCYNTLCPGFVQVSRKFALGNIAKPVSTYGGQQYHMAVSIHQDHKGDWWFVLRGEPIGYWPKSLFDVNGLGDGAHRVFWGGQVSSAVRQRVSPHMGSGHFPRDGYKKAAYMNGLRVIDHVSRKARIPPPSKFAIYANSPSCYNVSPVSGPGEDWSSAIYYGGPGGCTIR